MDCESAVRAVRLELDGELETGLVRDLEAHLSHCRACAARAQEDRRIASVVRAGAPPLSSSVLRVDCDPILRRVRQARQEDLSMIFLLRRVVAAAAVLIIGSGLLIGWNVSGEPRKAEAAVSIRAVALPATGMGMIDADNAIWIALGRR